MPKMLMMCGLPFLWVLAGCAADTSVPVTDLRPWKPITYSCKDTKATRVQILQHDSVYDTLKSGKKVVNQDRCPKTEAKVS